MTDVILIPGLWLDGSSWSRVVPLLEKAGHRAHPVTLPGMASKDADRSTVTMDNWVSAVVQAIDDAAGSARGKIALVGHSAGAGVATAGLDARPDRVARVFYVGGFPAPDGRPLMHGFAVTDGEVPFPGLAEFDEPDIRDLDDAARAEFTARAIPAPEAIVRDPLRLSSERRYDIPATAVCPEYTSRELREWITEGSPNVQEFAKIRDLDYADLDSGHWPQFTAPEKLATIILDRV